MRRDMLEREVRDVLARADFMVSEPHGLRSVSFDFVARREGLIVVARCVQNLCAVDGDSAREMKVLASTLGGSPLVVATHGPAGKLEDGVVHSRFGVPLMTVASVSDMFLEGVPPYVFAGPGGLYVRIDPKELAKARDAKFSIGELAEAAGVSRRAIQMYEAGMGAMLEAAMRLEKYLGREIILPVDPFSASRSESVEERPVREVGGLRGEVFDSLGKLGCRVLQTVHCPFDALTKERENIYFTGIVADPSKLGEKGMAAFNVAKIAGGQSVVFTRNPPTKKNACGSAVVGREELERVRDPAELKRLVRERGGAR